jgi:hypothetical protein
MQIFGYLFYIHSGNFVAFAESDILKFIWLESMIKTIQFINIQNGKCLIKFTKNQKFPVNVFSMKFRTCIQSACNAIYGPITKLSTVIGIKMIKYNFSVVIRVLYDT